MKKISLLYFVLPGLFFTANVYDRIDTAAAAPAKPIKTLDRDED